MNILVLGATGGTGREIVRQATAAGHTVTAFVRSAGSGGTFGAGTSVARGDARDQAAIQRALAGCQAVACSLGTAISGPFREVSFLSEATRALLAAMQATDVRRLVCITGVGAGDSRGHGGLLYDRFVQPLLLRGVYADKDRQEALIRASDRDWVIVRPTMLSDGPATGRVRALTDLRGFNGGRITRADVAAFVVAQLTSDEWLRQAPLITGGD